MSGRKKQSPWDKRKLTARRKLAEGFRKLANGKKFTAAERAEFARMADAWERTLPKKGGAK